MNVLEFNKMYNGDCMELLRQLPDNSVDLVLTDPPYNVAVQTMKNGKYVTNAWDRIPDYINWCMEWIKECCRVLKPTGVLYFWHNDMPQIAQLLARINCDTSLAFRSFCIWDKGDAYRAKSWKNRDPLSPTAPRCWFNIAEYCLHFFNAPTDGSMDGETGLKRILSNPECFKPLKEWYAAECKRLGLNKTLIAAKYTAVTGKKPYMLRHYFQDSQFDIPTKQVYEAVYLPLGFSKEYEELRQEYEELRQEYEELRQEYEELRPVHQVDPMHCNVWHMPPVPSTGRLHTCQKPLKILERLINVSSRPGDVVLDCFAGSGSTCVAAIHAGRQWIGVELDKNYYDIATARIEKELSCG